MAGAIITWSSAEDCTAVVRGSTGVFDTGRTDGRWWCSCGQAPACIHVERVEAVLADRCHNDAIAASGGGLR